MVRDELWCRLGDLFGVWIFVIRTAQYPFLTWLLYTDISMSARLLVLESYVQLFHEALH